jgi:hypothetical protein
MTGNVEGLAEVPAKAGVAACRRSGDRLDVFWCDEDGGIWHRTLGSGLARPTESLGGRSVGPPAVTCWSEDDMELFAVFDDGELWDRYWDGTGWHAWESLGTAGGGFVGAAAATSDGPDRLDVLAPARDGRIWHRWWDGAQWVPWERLVPGPNPAR